MSFTSRPVAENIFVPKFVLASAHLRSQALQTCAILPAFMLSLCRLDRTQHGDMVQHVFDDLTSTRDQLTALIDALAAIALSTDDYSGRVIVSDTNGHHKLADHFDSVDHRDYALTSRDIARVKQCASDPDDVYCLDRQPSPNYDDFAAPEVSWSDFGSDHEQPALPITPAPTDPLLFASSPPATPTSAFAPPSPAALARSVSERFLSVERDSSRDYDGDVDMPYRPYRVTSPTLASPSSSLVAAPGSFFLPGSSSPSVASATPCTPPRASRRRPGSLFSSPRSLPSSFSS